jgi:hypothetical protein
MVKDVLFTLRATDAGVLLASGKHALASNKGGTKEKAGGVASTLAG